MAKAGARCAVCQTRSCTYPLHDIFVLICRTKMFCTHTCGPASYLVSIKKTRAWLGHIIPSSQSNTRYIRCTTTIGPAGTLQPSCTGEVEARAGHRSRRCGQALGCRRSFRLCAGRATRGRRAHGGGRGANASSGVVWWLGGRRRHTCLIP